MSLKLIANTITNRLEQLANANSLTVRFDDDPRTTPTTDFWLKASVDFGSFDQTTVGVKQYRISGNLTVIIHHVVGSGISKLLELADIVMGAFKSEIVGTINFQTPKATNAGRDKDDWIITVTCPFYVDEN